VPFNANRVGFKWSVRNKSVPHFLKTATLLREKDPSPRWGSRYTA
jgi:hypothetical protein